MDVSSVLSLFKISTYPPLDKADEKKRSNDGAKKRPKKSGGDENKEKMGDPICDVWSVKLWQHCALFVLASGTGWGQRSLNSAQTACQAFTDAVSSTLHNVGNVEAAESLVQRGIRKAHDAIMAPVHSKRAEVEEVATATLTGVLAVELLDDDKYQSAVARYSSSSSNAAAASSSSSSSSSDPQRWAVLTVTVGDNMAFVVDSLGAHSLVRGFRSTASGVSDRCGKLGPESGFDPDLRNMMVRMALARSGDLLVLTTPGVNNNLDPFYLAPNERSGALGCEDDMRALMEARHGGVVARLGALLSSSSAAPLSAGTAAEALRKHVRAETKTMRRWMLDHPRQALPKTAGAMIPGWLGHASALLYRLGRIDLLDDVVDARIAPFAAGSAPFASRYHWQCFVPLGGSSATVDLFARVEERCQPALAQLARDAALAADDSSMSFWHVSSDIYMMLGADDDAATPHVRALEFRVRMPSKQDAAAKAQKDEKGAIAEQLQRWTASTTMHVDERSHSLLDIAQSARNWLVFDAQPRFSHQRAVELLEPLAELDEHRSTSVTVARRRRAALADLGALFGVLSGALAFEQDDIVLASGASYRRLLVSSTKPSYLVRFVGQLALGDLAKRETAVYGDMAHFLATLQQA
jgi:hypothetical protein